MSGTIVWFRQDLRLNDNPSLIAAAKRGAAIIPVYIWSPAEEGEWPPGSASKWWLHHSLQALDASLRARALRLIIARGAALGVLKSLARVTRADAVHFAERYEPAALAVSAAVRSGLSGCGLEVASFNASLLVSPDALLNLSGKPYRVYSAYRRRVLRDVKLERALRVPARLIAPKRWPRSLTIEALKLLPRIRWYGEMERTWTPGEAGAQRALRRFIRLGLRDYRTGRDHPAQHGTSRLSPHLHFGEIGPRQIRQALGSQGHGSQFLSELIWREFSYHLLFHFPHTTSEPLRPEFTHFAWRNDPRALRAWQRGRTGIALVDAGMRELWALGWMHNRVRMVVASLLVKNLLIPWQEGARWFWDTLVDADLAANTMNWQWVAGSGADAAPYFRVFNPDRQAQRFDAQGAYRRRWARGEPLKPIVDLAESREAALEAYQQLRRRSQGATLR